MEVKEKPIKEQIKEFTIRLGIELNKLWYWPKCVDLSIRFAEFEKKDNPHVDYSGKVQIYKVLAKKVK